jgi:FtsZ-interacting cell division protein ZipA
MTNKQSNRISLIVAVLAIVLILGGVYILQRSFASSSTSTASNNVKTTTSKITPKTTTITPTTTTSQPGNKSTNVATSNSGSATTTTPSSSAQNTAPASSTTTQNQSQSAAAKPTQPAQPIQTVPTTQTQPANSTSNPVKTVSAGNLEQNQFTAKYLGGNQFEIVNCGRSGSQFCVPSGKVALTGGVVGYYNPAQDKTYRVTADWNEGASVGMLFSSVGAMEEVK